MKPGSRSDREEMVRILVQDVKANVHVLDMHDYRLAGGAAARGNLTGASPHRRYTLHTRGGHTLLFAGLKNHI